MLLSLLNIKSYMEPHHTTNSPPMTEQELPVATVLKTSNLHSEPMDGLTIPPKGSTSNFKSNRHRLTLHQLSNDEIKPPGGENL
ncbi:hypothetical protein MRB53_033055 [Persea americana]|uniref:Uncharacterized protein n=1 Tax=Persea americana TaxID=3435 RepID=A0ACC2KTS3_PERAE|nr:hypothetical protein MRB53_033055 [Persea americana]